MYDPAAVLAALDNGLESNNDDAQVEYFEEEYNPWANVAINNADLVLGGWIFRTVHSGHGRIAAFMEWLIQDFLIW